MTLKGWKVCLALETLNTVTWLTENHRIDDSMRCVAIQRFLLPQSVLVIDDIQRVTFQIFINVEDVTI